MKNKWTEENGLDEQLHRHEAAFKWLLNLPAVQDGRIHVDTRGCWPIVIRGLAAHTCETKGDVVEFIVNQLP